MPSSVIAVMHPRGEARRALQVGYPRGVGRLRTCRNASVLERVLYGRLVDAVVFDIKSAPASVLDLPARFPRIPFFVMSLFRPDDGRLIAQAREAGVAGLLVEGVDNAIAGEWVAARTAHIRRRNALADGPRLLRLTDPLQLLAWEEVLRRMDGPVRTGEIAQRLRVTREHLSREFGAGGAPNLKRVIDLARTACAADLLGNPGYSVRSVVQILSYASSSHLAAASRRVAGVRAAELGRLGPGGVLVRFARGRTRSRL